MVFTWEAAELVGFLPGKYVWVGVNIVTRAWREKVDNDSWVFSCSGEGCQMKWQGASCETSQKKYSFQSSTKHVGKHAGKSSAKD